MMEGHEWIQQTLGVKPTIGWDIDTFGHSAANTRIYSELGFEAMFFSRMEGYEKHVRVQEANRGMNFLWRPDKEHFGNQHQIMTVVFSIDYCHPAGFLVGAGYEADDPFVTDESLSTYNAKDKAVDLINWAQIQTK